VNYYGSKDDATPHFTPLSFRWSNVGKSGRAETYDATIENFPFIRTRWQVQELGAEHVDQFGNHIVFTPLFPIQGRVRVLSATDQYDPLGNPISHFTRYTWVTNSIATLKP
jgi:hypothetical protein